MMTTQGHLGVHSCSQSSVVHIRNCRFLVWHSQDLLMLHKVTAIEWCYRHIMFRGWFPGPSCGCLLCKWCFLPAISLTPAPGPEIEELLKRVTGATSTQVPPPSLHQHKNSLMFEFVLIFCKKPIKRLPVNSATWLSEPHRHNCSGLWRE
jgi:hypothetical protein